MKPYIKNIIHKTSPLIKQNNSIKNNIKDFYKKEIKNFNKNELNKKYFSNNINNNINFKNNKITLEKNTKDNKRRPLQKKFKSNNYLKSNISAFNTFKQFLNNNKTSKNLLTLESKNQSTNKLSSTTSSLFSGSNTNRNKDNNNKNEYTSIYIENKSQKNDSIFISVNESAINIDDSKYNKIKVNTININKKLQNISNNNSGIINAYNRINKKPKNICLINNYNNDMKKKKNVSIKVEPSYEKYLKGNLQILNFNKNNNLQELNNLKNHTKYNLTYNNSKSIISESSLYTDGNNNNN